MLTSPNASTEEVDKFPAATDMVTSSSAMTGAEAGTWRREIDVRLRITGASDINGSRRLTQGMQGVASDAPARMEQENHCTQQCHRYAWQRDRTGEQGRQR